MIRTQLYLPDAMHARLKRLAEERGTTLSELVREALARSYAILADEDAWRRNVDAAAGLWRGREDLSADFDREIRGGRRLASLLLADDE